MLTFHCLVKELPSMASDLENQLGLYICEREHQCTSLHSLQAKVEGVPLPLECPILVADSYQLQLVAYLHVIQFQIRFIMLMSACT